MKEILKKVRRYEIEIRKAVNSGMHGNFNSVFKGNGLEFDDLRAYQYGDDIRSINWNVTAKGHGAFVNTFKEDKEQNVFFLVDVSASHDIGVKKAKKIDLAKEIASVLAFSAVQEHSDIGLIAFSDQKEKYLKPGRGEKHAYAIFNALYSLKPKSKKTNLKKAFEYTRSLVTKKSVIIIISDFIDSDYEKSLQALAHKHDLVAIHLYDASEMTLPEIGISPLLDLESNKLLWRNTFSSSFRKEYAHNFKLIEDNLVDFSRRNQVNYVKVKTKINYVTTLIQMFNLRNKTKKSG